jgi:ferredoxin
MSVSSAISLATFLDRHDDAAWADVVSSLLPSIHEVDRNATRIWFAFFPLVLARALEETNDLERLVWRLQLQGHYRLAEQIDTSHAVLYGPRYWPAAKRAAEEAAKTGAPADGSLERLVRDVAGAAAKTAGVDVSLAMGIAAVAVMTLQQVGLEAFEAAAGKVTIEPSFAALSPEKVIERREKIPGRGLFGFLRSIDRRWPLTFDETRENCTIPAITGQDLAMAAAEDTRDYQSRDPRCVEGPIPIECRTAACGTCWVGVIAGAERLAEVDDREWRKMKEFGYLDTDEPRPILRLACRAKVEGPVTIVVPPWNGVFGKLRDGKLDPKKVS